MRTGMRWTFLLPCTLACATATGVLREPVSGGRGQRYTVPADSVATATASAFRLRGLRVVRDTMIGPTRLLLGMVGVTPLSWGELDRVAIIPLADASEARIVSRPVNQLDFLHRNSSPLLFREIDRQLGGVGIGPFVGDRVRIVTNGSGQKTLTGRMLMPADSSGALSIEVGGRDTFIATAEVARISISRGGYGHPKEGGIAGFLVGGAIGIAVAPGGTSGRWGGLERVGSFMLGSLIGLVTGGVVGAVIRTEIWSDVSPGRPQSGSSSSTRPSPARAPGATPRT